MKKIISGSVFVFIGVLFLMILLTYAGRSSRKTETDTALAEAIDTTLASIFTNRTYTTTADTDEFIADFLEALLLQVESDSDVKISVLEADPEKGILSVEVTETYRHPNGNTGTVSAVRTVIFDREEEKKTECHQVEFYVADGELYKSYTLPDAATCAYPADPQREGKRFKCWRFVTGGNGVAGSVSVPCADGRRNKTALSSGGNPVSVTENIKLVAVFE